MFWFPPLILGASFLFALDIHLAQHPSRTPCHDVKKKSRGPVPPSGTREGGRGLEVWDYVTKNSLCDQKTRGPWP